MREGRRRGMFLVAALTVMGGLVSRQAGATTASTNIPNTLRDVAATDAAEDLLVRADEVLNSITYTVYSSAAVWDPGDGVYKLVCAAYLNHLLDEALPGRYDDLRDSYGDLGVWDYFDFFSGFSYGEAADGWKRITRVADLRPGDLVVWRYNTAVTSGAWGHGVVVASVPVRDYRFTNAYKVRVSDATSTPHSNDNRAGSSGVGAGEMLFRAYAESGKPKQIAWTLSGYWKDPTDTTIVMMRPTAP